MTDRVTGTARRPNLSFFSAGGPRSTRSGVSTDASDTANAAVTTPTIVSTNDQSRHDDVMSNQRSPQQGEAAFRAAVEEAAEPSNRKSPTEILSLALKIATGGSGRIVSPGVESALAGPSENRDATLIDAVVDMASRGYGSLTGRASVLKAHHDRRA